MILLKLTWQSLWNRRTTLLLTILSIAISVSLVLGVEYIRKEARQSFMNTISDTDLVVGARSGPVQLLLYSVFRIGNATNNISWDSYQEIAQHKWVKWTVPLSLGDSHKGYRVLGTNTDYFTYYRYADKRELAFLEGKPFAGVYGAVLGAEVARKLGYQLGDKIVIAHGAGSTSFSEHKNKPFTVSGILKPTGTAVDRTVHVTLEGIEAIHIDWRAGTPIPGLEVSAEKAASMNLQPKVITAFLVGLKTRTAAFRLQREINEYKPEALLATIPGIALSELWRAIGQFEVVLRIITFFVLIAGLLGMLTTLLTTLNERRREMAILRAVGVPPSQVFFLFVLEAVIIAVLGGILGMLLLGVGILLSQPWIAETYGFYLRTWLPQTNDWLLLSVVVGLAALFSTLPAWIAYRRSLQDGLTVKI
ncbi:MAG: ABC-type antimicrobial peptide transport system, permease component [uncultured Thiotrichaceae bacterium]|uniref:ABC-type antimicrobial peptide transport system, permease component n=1 Tax=uncultured Thiotrichaceae bacterium TaxID=298394 RepID=A0A6S6U7U7_9GAMM|nr:MAG: ABC-type antimicrobial peptide transport system, permease component [uncultured Thiotrichaceae bacterium]